MNRNRLFIVGGFGGLSVICLCLLIFGGWFVKQGMSGEGPLAMLATATNTPKPTRTPIPSATSTSTSETTPTDAEVTIQFPTYDAEYLITPIVTENG